MSGGRWAYSRPVYREIVGSDGRENSLECRSGSGCGRGVLFSGDDVKRTSLVGGCLRWSKSSTRVDG